MNFIMSDTDAHYAIIAEIVLSDLLDYYNSPTLVNKKYDNKKTLNNIYGVCNK